MTSFMQRKLTIFLIAFVSALIVLDVKTHGSFKASKTGVFLKDSGALHYGELALTRFRYYSQQAYRWSQKNLPVYVTKTRESVAPYLLSVRKVLTTLALQLWTNIKLVCQYFVDKKPLVEQWIDQYAPGLLDVVQSWLSWFWALLREYIQLVTTLMLKYWTLLLQWLRENVFVGTLSPENLQRFTMEAFNTTQKLAVETFSWLNSKVITVVSAS